ncbi:MAG: hypothetical protein LIP28_04750, partial [Deltaproteobacteria bacterium]|nr:hypothetical protein [Deltaproteobacteria bacterium]
MKIQTNFKGRKTLLSQWLEDHHLGLGAVALFLVLIALSAVASINFDSGPTRRFLAGEVATAAVLSDYGFVGKDTRASAHRRE